MGGILVQDDPHLLLRMPAPDTPHKLAHKGGIFTWIEGPMDLAGVRIIAQKEIEPAPRFLPLF